MSEVSERYGRIAADFSKRVGALSADDWAAQTPCTEWRVRDLLAHVVGVHQGMLGRLHGTDPVEVDADGDLPAQWNLVTAAVSAALLDPESAATSVQGFGGETSFESLAGGLLCADTLVHVWDLSRATGQDERLDPAAVTVCIDTLAAFDEGMRRPGGFGEKIEPAPDADEQTRLLNFCGRAV